MMILSGNSRKAPFTDGMFCMQRTRNLLKDCCNKLLKLTERWTKCMPTVEVGLLSGLHV